MFLLEIDRTENRIHMTLSERFDEMESRELLEQLNRRIEEIEHDFSVLCDLSSLTEFDHNAKLCFRKVMDVCNAKGVKKIIRVLPDPRNNFGLTVMSYFHYGNKVKLINCKSMKEAQKHL